MWRFQHRSWPEAEIPPPDDINYSTAFAIMEQTGGTPVNLENSIIEKLNAFPLSLAIFCFIKV